MKGFSEHYVDKGDVFSLESPALLIVDMLNDFCTEGGCMLLREGREAIRGIQALIAQFHAENLPVLYINDCHRKDR